MKARSAILQAFPYSAIALILLGIRAHNFAPPPVEAVAMQATLTPGESGSEAQLELGRNVLSDMVVVRATYLLELAQTQPNAVTWLDNHRGQTLGQLRAADTQRGGVWGGKAADNANADLVVESLAIELTRTWLQTKQATPAPNYTLANYLASARMAGQGGTYDPGAMALYLAAIGVISNETQP